MASYEEHHAPREPVNLEPPRRLQLAPGEWLRVRRLGGGQAVMTAPDGRFVLRPAPPDGARLGDDERQRLAELGFLFASEAPTAVPAPAGALHVVQLESMTGAEASALSRELLARAADFVRLDLVAARPLPFLADLLRDAHAVFVGERARPSIALRAPLEALTPEVVDASIDARAELEATVHRLDDAAAAHLRAVHARFAARGLPPELAFVRVVVPLTRAIAEVGPERLVEGFARAGVVYAELDLAGTDLDPEEAGALYGAILGRVVEVNARGTPLVEMRLALHLETLASRGDPRRSPAPSATHHAWGAGGRETVGDASLARAGCAGCAYDPYCGEGLLQRAVGADPASRRFGTPFCGASLASFDATFDLLASPASPRVRRVFAGWMAAHARVQRRFSGPDRSSEAGT